MVWLLRRHMRQLVHVINSSLKNWARSTSSIKSTQWLFRLDLPSHYRIHNVFHASLLELYHSSSIPGRQIAPPPPVELVTGDEYEVERILDSHRNQRKLLYLVLWKGYPISEATWEPTDNLINAPDGVHHFHLRYPDKPAPPRRGRLRGG